MSEARGKENGARGWRGDKEEEAQPGGGALPPGFLGGVKDVWVSHPSPLGPQGLQVRVKDRRSSWVGNIQSRGEVRHSADQMLSSQSSHSLSFFQGKAEPQGPFGPDLGLMPRFFRRGCRISGVSWVWLVTSCHSQDRKWSRLENRAALWVNGWGRAFPEKRGSRGLVLGF